MNKKLLLGICGGLSVLGTSAVAISCTSTSSSTSPQNSPKETKLKKSVFSNKDFLNASSLEDAKQKLTSDFVFEKRSEIFSGEFSDNLSPKNIKIEFFNSENRDEARFSITFDKGTIYDASGNLSTEDVSFDVRIVGIILATPENPKIPVTLKNGGTFSNSAFLNATDITDAEKRFDANFVFTNRAKIFNGDFVSDITKSDFRVTKRIVPSSKVGATKELLFTIVVVANKSYNADGSLRGGFALDGKITNIPVTPENTKVPVTLKNEGIFSNSVDFLNATDITDAEKRFDANFVFTNRAAIFNGDFVSGITKSDFRVTKRIVPSSKVGATKEFLFTIVVANKTYNADGSLRGGFALDGKIINIPATKKI